MRLRGLTTLILLFSGAVAPAGEGVVALSRGAAVIQGPRLASHQFHTAAVWSETDATGRFRVRGGVFRDGRLAQTAVNRQVQFLDSDDSGDNVFPAVSINPRHGKPAYAWVHLGDGETSAVVLREGGKDPVVLATTTAVVEQPVVAHDGGGWVWVAWTELSGDQSTVFVAGRDAEGRWATQSLASSERPYDVLPRLFPRRDGSVEACFFSLSGREFFGTSFVLGDIALPEAGSFPAGLPADRLPLLHQDRERLGAVWVEPSEGGDVYLRLSWNSDGEPVVAPLGRGAEARVTHVAVADGAVPAVAWFESVPGAATELVVRTAANEPVRRPVGAVPSAPAISLSNNWTHVAWLHEDLQSGSHSLNYIRLPR